MRPKRPLLIENLGVAGNLGERPCVSGFSVFGVLACQTQKLTRELFPPPKDKETFCIEQNPFGSHSRLAVPIQANTLYFVAAARVTGKCIPRILCACKLQTMRMRFPRVYCDCTLTRCKARSASNMDNVNMNF